MDVITIWFAVTQSVRANGCVRMIPGSHRLGLQKHSSKRDENHILNQVDPAVLDESETIDIELEPGDISVHHPLLLHGSKPNTSTRWRRGGSIQYIPATTRITRDWPCVFLFRGAPVEGINTYRPFPKYV
jgi:ectoine hydroxylase-related dioxygenase (phytanoyl-CoA dioxygenase family)